MQDIANILEWLGSENEMLFLQIFGIENIKLFIFTAYDINTLFLFLSPENKDMLANVLGLDFMKWFVRTPKDFRRVFSCLTLKKGKEFLELFTKNDLCVLFRNDSVFHDCLLKLSDSKERLLLSYLQE